jgi:hypothetical protein
MAIKFCTSICTDTTNPTTISKLQLADVEAKTTETAIAYIKADGCIVSGTSSGGGSLNMSGSTVGGLTTYVDSTTICAEPNITWNGTTRILTVVPGNTSPTLGSARLGMANFCQGTADEDDYLYSGHIVLGQSSNLGYYAMGTASKSYRGTNATYTYAHMVVSDSGYLYTKYGANATDATAAAAGTWNIHPRQVGFIANTIPTIGGCGLICGQTNLRFCGGSCLCTPNIIITSGATSGGVLTSDATGLGKWCETVDISSNLGTGDLLYYDGSTISGSTFTQNSATVTTFKGQCLVLDSETGIKQIQMCPVSLSIGANSLYICAANNSTCTGGNLYLYGGESIKSNAGSIYGGDITMCAGMSCLTYGTSSYISYGGDLFLGAGDSCNCTNYLSCGGHVYICGGNGYMTFGCTLTYSRGGNICLIPGLSCCTTYCGLVCVARRLYVYGYGGTGVGLCLATGCGYGDWYDTSDRRKKKDIQPITNALSVVAQLDGVRYHKCPYSGESEDNNYKIGLIAQDVAKVLPEVVGCSPVEDENDIAMGITDYNYAINYGKLTAVLIEAMKEQQAQIELLQEEVYKLKK